MGDYMAEAVVSQVKRIHTEIARAVRNCQNNLGANEDLIFQVASVPGVQVELFGIAYDMLNFGRRGQRRSKGSDYAALQPSQCCAYDYSPPRRLTSGTSNRIPWG
jgi:hypothetical protein